LQSIMPAPVDSRRSLTIAAVIVAMSLSSFACDGDRMRLDLCRYPPSPMP
jgi:hypothetical protein